MHNQIIMLKIGILLGRDNLNFDIDQFDNMEELRVYLNGHYNINIEQFMKYDEVLTLVEKGIANNRYNNAMDIL